MASDSKSALVDTGPSPSAAQPAWRPAAAPAAPRAAGPAAPPEALARALADARPTLEACVAREQVDAGGEVRVRLTVEASGAVRDAEVDRADLERTDLGRCLRTRARRLRFEPFHGGAAVDLELALALGAAP